MNCRRGGRLLALAGVLAVGTVVGGCGGDDNAPITQVGPSGASGASGAQGALSKNAFIDQADSICSESQAAIAALGTGQAGTAAGDQVTQQLETTRSELNSIKSLNEPSEDRATLEDFVSALEDEVSALEDEQSALDQGDQTAATAAQTDYSTAQSSAQDAARQYGLKDCAKGPGEVPSPSGGGTVSV